MTFFTFIGGLTLLVLLVLCVPRTSFVVLLGMYLHYYKGIVMFYNWDKPMGILGIAVTILLFFGGIIALFLDWYTANAIKDNLKNL